MKTTRPNTDRHDTADLRGLLEASGVVGTWEWDIVGRSIRYDPGAAALLTGDAGLAWRDLDRSVATARIHPLDAEWLDRKTRRAIEIGGPFLAEYRVLPREGGERWILSRGRLDLGAEGRAIQGRGILIDITETRKAGQGSAAHLGGGALDAFADHCLVAQQCLQADGTPLLRMLMNTVLLELGHEIARRLKRRQKH